MKENLSHVSRLVAAEVTSLREQYEREKETAQRMKSDADKVRTFYLLHTAALFYFITVPDRVFVYLACLQYLCLVFVCSQCPIFVAI